MALDADPGAMRTPRGRPSRRTGAPVLLAMLVALLLLWGAWRIVAMRAALTRSPAARRVNAACTLSGWVLVYRLAPLGRGGALCSALIHQDAYYSYDLGNIVPAHWARLDCAVAAPQGPPYCSEHVLFGPGDWLGLTGAPATEVTALHGR